LTSPYKNTSAFSEDIIVKITDNNQCHAISTVELIVYDAPKLLEDDQTYYCTDTYPTTKRLFAGVLSGPPNDYTYDWFFDGTSTGITTYFIDINALGIYSVDVTDSNNCTVSRAITGIGSTSAIIDEILIEEGTYNNTVTINVSGDGVYEYALDTPFGDYQDSNNIIDVFPGFHTVYVRDKNGCAITSEEISVLGFPKFFTPNNDGENDTWQAFGVDGNNNADIDIQIFDRFGKIITRLNAQSNGWDGSYNGIILPATDYWFVAYLADGRVYRGHFTLKR